MISEILLEEQTLLTNKALCYDRRTGKHTKSGKDGEDCWKQAHGVNRDCEPTAKQPSIRIPY